jgi:hypothetical protein
VDVQQPDDTGIAERTRLAKAEADAFDRRQNIPVRPQLCRCQDIEPPAAVARSVLMRRHDIRQTGERPPNLRAMFNHAERMVWATKLDEHGQLVQDEDALYYAALEVAVAAMAVMDHIDRPQP